MNDGLVDMVIRCHAQYDRALGNDFVLLCVTEKLNLPPNRTSEMFLASTWLKEQS
jgi:hypothetical protein